MKIIIVSGNQASGKSIFMDQMAARGTASWSVEALLQYGAEKYENQHGEDLIVDMVYTNEMVDGIHKWLVTYSHMFNNIYIAVGYNTQAEMLRKKIDSCFELNRYRDLVFHVRMIRK